MSKFWKFKNISEDEGELILYGEIMDEKPWWDSEAGALTPKEFTQELGKMKDKKKITLRINSCGGDVFAAQAIYTQMKAHTANIEVIIDGLAASAATIIAMAGDTIKIPANALMMIHNPAVGMMGWYSAEELERLSGYLDVVKDSIIEAYTAKTGMDNKVISKLMDSETWMTGRDAVKQGFADELMFETPISPSVENSGKILVINNVKHDISNFKNSPQFGKWAIENIPNLFNSSSQPLAVNDIKPKPKGDERMGDIKDVSELKNTYPDMVKQAEDAAREEGAKNERQRIQDIEKIAKNMAPELVNEAKFEEPIDARELAFKALQDDAGKGQQYLNNALKDVKDSGAGDVTAQSNTQQTEQGKKEAEDKAAEGTANAINRKRGIK